MYFSPSLFSSRLFSPFAFNLKGSKQVHQVGANPDEIKMETSNKYQKQIQRQLPQPPEHWYTLETGKSSDQDPMLHIPEKGQKRWVGLPEPIDVSHGYFCCT